MLSIAALHPKSPTSTSSSTSSSTSPTTLHQSNHFSKPANPRLETNPTKLPSSPLHKLPFSPPTDQTLQQPCGFSNTQSLHNMSQNQHVCRRCQNHKLTTDGIMLIMF
ncbi:hypothetical protein M758_5G017900 [Ceratodon purpureus]|nr:hypothetical protein M758_5G017900 [Ceratodon purpureus]